MIQQENLETDVNNVSSFTGVTAASRTNALLKTLSADGAVQLEIGKQGTVDGTTDEWIIFCNS